MTDRYRWIAIAVFIACGAGLVGFGLLDGNAWLAAVGGVLGGGAAARAVP